MYLDWLYGSPTNYDERIIDEYYLNFDYRYTSGIKYKILPQNVGYMYYGSFSSTIGDGNLDQILAYLSTSTGLIIDVRSNGGGSLSNVTPDSFYAGSRQQTEKDIINRTSQIIEEGASIIDIFDGFGFHCLRLVI